MLIHQMSSVVGWAAVYASEKPDAVGNPFEVVPLIALALTEDDNENCATVGMVPEGPDITPAPRPNFLGYLAPGQSLDDFLPVLEEWRADQAEEEAREAIAEAVRGGGGVGRGSA